MCVTTPVAGVGVGAGAELSLQGLVVEQEYLFNIRTKVEK